MNALADEEDGLPTRQEAWEQTWGDAGERAAESQSTTGAMEIASRVVRAKPDDNTRDWNQVEFDKGWLIEVSAMFDRSLRGGATRVIERATGRVMRFPHMSRRIASSLSTTTWYPTGMLKTSPRIRGQALVSMVSVGHSPCGPNLP